MARPGCRFFSLDGKSSKMQVPDCIFKGAKVVIMTNEDTLAIATVQQVIREYPVDKVIFVGGATSRSCRWVQQLPFDGKAMLPRELAGGIKRPGYCKMLQP